MLIGASIILFMVIISVFAPFITRYSLWKQDYSSLLQKPGESHLFGTDHYGRDTFTRIIYGGRISLLSALGAASMAGVIGVFLGLLAGYFGGYVNRIIQALVDIFWSFPSLLMALVLVVIMGPGIVSVMVAIAFGYWPEYAQVIRSEVLSIRKKEYVIAARALGNTDLKIIFKHILPNVIAPVVVLITITMGYAIIVEASLSFLGLGIQPPMSSWGTLLSDSREFLAHAPWLSIFPGLAIIITVLGFNMFGDGLRDFLDPYQRGL